MSDFEDEDMPELSPVSSPTLSVTSDYDCGEDDNFIEDASNGSAASDKEKQQDNAIVISGSSSSSTLSTSIGEKNPAQSQDLFSNQNNVRTIMTSINIDSNNYTPTEQSAVNMDQINNHMERVNLSGSKTANHSITITSGPKPTTSLYQSKHAVQNTNRPSAVIRPNIHAPSTSKGTGLITKLNRITSVRKHKRIRTAFNSQQLMGLEKEYSKTRYIDRNFRINLANALSLSEKTIKVWFQNRRMKEKKDKAEEEFEDTELNDSSKVITNDNEDYQFPTNVNFNRGTNVYSTSHYPTTQSVRSNPQLSMNNSVIPNCPVYIQNTKNQPPLMNQFYHMSHPQQHIFQHQQPYIQMQQPVFQPQQHQMQNQLMQFQQMPIQQAQIQQMQVHQLMPQMQVQQIHIQKFQEIVPKTESEIESSTNDLNHSFRG